MIENDIRPDALKEKQKKYLQQDIEWLLERKEEFVDALCPACSSSSASFKFFKKGFRYVSCNKCETFYLSPRPPLKVIHEFYRHSVNYEYWNKYIFPASEEARKEKIFKPRVDKVISLCKKFESDTACIVEVGAGFGTFCEEMQKRNFFDRVVAVEPTPNLVTTCRLKNIETIELPIEEVKQTNLCDVLVSFEVIEHLFSPGDFLKSSKKLLVKGGFLILSCPNGAGFEIDILGKESGSVDHEHLNYFSPNSLCYLLENLGFEILEVQTPGVLDAELVRKAVLSGKISLDSNVFLKNILVDKWSNLGEKFQNFLATTNQSSHMMVIARKIG